MAIMDSRFRGNDTYGIPSFLRKQESRKMGSHPRVREDKVVKIALKQCIMWLTEKLVLYYNFMCGAGEDIWDPPDLPKK